MENMYGDAKSKKYKWSRRLSPQLVIQTNFIHKTNKKDDKKTNTVIFMTNFIVETAAAQQTYFSTIHFQIQAFS